MKIHEFDFQEDKTIDIRNSKYGNNWPVVYLIHNDNEMYIGETTKVSARASQHLKNPERRKLRTIKIIGDDRFNKSAVLDIESNLIKYVSADEKFILQNHNFGIQSHDYFNKSDYEQIFFEIWRRLKLKGIVLNSLVEIENSDLFKFSPYKSLTDDQFMAVDFILGTLNERYESSTTTLVHGSAGTGKTVLAIYLMKLIESIRNGEYVFDEELSEDDVPSLRLKEKIERTEFSMAFVVPMTSLRNTIKKVFKNVKGLSPNMVIGPNDLALQKYDLIVVDEAHRLPQRKNIAGFKAFDDVNKKLDFEKDADSLDWIIKQGRHVILFYDEAQSIRPSDVRHEKFAKLLNRNDLSLYELKSQMRSLGGSDYIKYIQEIMKGNSPVKTKFKNFDSYIFENIDVMIREVKKRDNELGLSRLVAGYGWKWKSKKNPDLFDIEIDDVKLKWNSTNNDWVNSPNAINEVGCIHTTQGYDLNYVGIIVGEDLKYDKSSGKIIVDKECYFDRNGFAGITDANELDNYIKNIYMTLMFRGIRGVYIYICNEDLREYFKQFVNQYSSD